MNWALLINMSAIPSSNLQYQEQSERICSDMRDECKFLLDQLDDGIYTIEMKKLVRSSKEEVKNKQKDKSVKVLVETNIDLKQIFYLKKPLIIKKITISGYDLSYLDSWPHDQISELNAKLVLILHGFYLHG